MHILSINCGSSSVKAALHERATGARLAAARVENLGTPQVVLRAGSAQEALQASITHGDAVQRVIDAIRTQVRWTLAAVAHRVVHGGERFTAPVLIDDQVLAELDALGAMAPLHNPLAVAAIRQARIALPDVPQIAVFDTSFHATLPPRAREYALPRDLSQRLQLRRFGFHGLSHEHVMHAVAGALHAAPQALRIISCHLGNGASVAAIEYGRSIDTSMGMTPLEGLVMGTRAGDVDPGIVLRLMEEGLDARALEALLNRQSGLKGLTGTEDMAVIEQRAAGGDEACRLAITLFAHRVRKYVGAYAAVMGGVDAIAFTGGIGEHSPLLRHRILQRLEFLGAVLDEDANRDAKRAVESPIDISARESRVRLFIVAADEERSLALAAARLLAQRERGETRVRIPLAISARHAHLSQASIDRLFGSGYQLQVHAALSQPGQYSAQETVTLIGPRGRIEHVRLMGPPRAEDQVEISRSDEFRLGIDAPVRISGDTADSPGISIEGPRGTLTLRRGVICARRHIHMHPDDARALQVVDHQLVSVRIAGAGRATEFGDVMVRISPDFRLEMHLDTDEANAAGVCSGDAGELVLPAAG